ncbi:MAG: hypothetical protein ACFFKA_17730 [Candidatus Thorarchaeota archaeon]
MYDKKELLVKLGVQIEELETLLRTVALTEQEEQEIREAIQRNVIFYKLLSNEALYTKFMTEVYYKLRGESPPC